MPRLEHLSIGQRMAIMFGIVLAILLALALYGYLTGAWQDEAQAQSLSPQPAELSKYERRFIELDRAAVDHAYQDQIMHLFQTWMKDDREQPKRAVTGARQARSAYERIMDAIAEREKRLPAN